MWVMSCVWIAVCCVTAEEPDDRWRGHVPRQYKEVLFSGSVHSQHAPDPDPLLLEL